MAEEAEDREEIAEDLDQSADIEAPEPEVQAEEPQQPGFDPEAIARLAGWAPMDEWRGDPGKWKDAQTFIVDTVAINKALQTKVRDLEQGAERLTRTADRIIQENTRRAIHEAEGRLRYAVQTGDEEAAVEATRELNAAAQAQTGEDPAVAAFKARNPWFGLNPAATAIANAVATDLHQRGANAAAQAKAAEDEVRRRFPELFGDEERVAQPRTAAKPQPPVQSGQRTPAAPRAKGFHDLPPDAKKAAQDFARRGRCTLEEYARTYYEENA
jgi:hypothetical protein